MKHISGIIIIAALFGALSCAESKSEGFNDIEDRLLDVWVQENAPGAIPLDDTGMYYEVIENNSQANAGTVDVRGKWVDVDYVIRDLNGDIVYNRNEQSARLLGTFNKYTHYIPDRLYIAGKHSATNIPSGIYEALTSIPPGDMWRVYIPSRKAFSSSGITISTGYGGQKNLESNVPVILDSLRISDIIDNPQSVGREAVKLLATSPEPQGWEIPVNDTVRDGMYLQVFRRINDTDTVAMNQAADIYYKVRFLDGKLIDSNVDSVLYNNFGTIRKGDNINPVKVTRMEGTPTNVNQMPAKIFYEILPHLCYGDIARVAVPSEYGYYRHYMYPDKSETMWAPSSVFTYDFTYQYKDYTIEDTDYYFGAGSYYMPYSSSSSIPIAEIKPYTPLIYEFTVHKPKK